MPKISDLSAAAAITAADLVPVVQGGTTVKMLATALGGTPRTTAETSGGITPSDCAYEPGYVLRYGADPTGVTDASTAIKNCIEANARVVFAPGTYKVSAQIAATITGNLVIEGNGAVLSSNMADAGTYQAALKIIGGSASRISGRDFSVVHTGGSGATLDGIQITTLVEMVQFENVRASGFRYYGAEINATQQVHNNCRYVDNVHGGLVPYGGTWLLNGTECSNNGNGTDNTTGYGVVGSGTNGKISGGRYEDNDRYNIDGRHADNLVVDGAYTGNAGYVSIYAVNEDATKDAKNIKIVNTTVDQENRAGSDMAIWVGATGAGGTVSPGEVLIHGNTVKNCLGEGVVVSTGSGSYPPKLINISKNQISETDDLGIVVSGTAVPKSVIVDGNQLQEANEIQVTVGDLAQITNNSFTYAGAETRLIYSAATKSIITGNAVNGTNTAANAIETTSTSYVIDNTSLGSYCIGSATYDPASLADGAGVTTTLSVPGAALGDYAEASFSLALQGITLTAWVSAADTLSVRFQNESGGVLDLGSGTLRGRVRKVR